MKQFITLVAAFYCCGYIYPQSYQAKSSATPVKLHKTVALQNGNLIPTLQPPISQSQVKSPKSQASGANYNWCRSEEITNNYISEQTLLNTDYPNLLNKFYGQVQQWIDNNPNYLQQKALKTIPVVVHIVYNTPDENISDALVYNMLSTLNKDFQRLNSDTNQTRSIFKPVAADAQIEFCLAQRDPSNNPTTGITRTTTTKTYFDPDTETDNMKKNTTGGKDAWNPFKYLNIWICDIDNGAGFGIAGYAYLPTPGMHGTWRDGLVLDNNIGICNNCRTATHEIGHYLGLQHTWGSNPPSCSNDDGFTDTPTSASENYGCNTAANTCNDGAGDNPDQIENYMSYADCQNMFSTEQGNYMNSVLNTTRGSLLTSPACQPAAPPVADFSASPNPVFVGSSVQFTDLSTGFPTSWSWNFGGGGTPNTATAQNTSAAFNTIGTYTITLIAANSMGSDTVIKTNYISVIAVPPCGIAGAIFCEDFESATIPALPAGWTTIVNFGSDSFKTGVDTTASSGAFGISEHTQFAFSNDDNCNCDKANDILALPTIDFSGKNNVVMLFNSFMSNDLSSLYLDSCFILASANGGTSWDTVFRFPKTDSWVSNAADLSAYDNMSGIMLRFAYSDLGNWGYGVAIDDVIVKENNNNDLSIQSINKYDTIQDTEYLLVPNRQTGTVRPNALVKNVGANTQPNVVLNVKIYDENLQVIYNENSTAVTLNSFQETTIWTTSYQFTKTSTGWFAFEFTVSSDSADNDTQNNSWIDYYYITDTVYERMDTLPPYYALSASSYGGTTGPYGFANFYEITRKDTATSVTFIPYSTSIAGTKVRAVIYNSSITQVAQSADYTLQSADLDNYVTLMLTSPYPMDSNNYYRVAVHSIDTGAGNVRFFSGTVPPNGKTSRLNADLGTGLKWYIINEVPWISLNMKPSVITCNDTVSVSVVNANCGVCDGQAVASVAGNNGPFTYQWNDPSVQTAATATGLCPGSYQVLVSSASGLCSYTSGGTVANAAGITSIATSTTNEVCGNGTGTATVNVTGGTSPYSYQWNTTPVQNTQTATGLSAGTYQVTATDNNGCTISTDFYTAAVVSDYTDIANVFSMSSADVSCNGDSDGTATVIAQTTPQTHTVTVQNFSFTPATVNAVVGDTIYWTWVNGFHTTTSTAIPSGASTWNSTMSSSSTSFKYVVTKVGTHNYVCTPHAPGMAGVINVSESFSYQWSNGQTSATATGLATGNYYVTVTDGNGCTGTDSVTISQPAAVSIDSVIVANALCSGDSGSANAFASGGTGAISFSWSNGGSLSMITAGAGTYSVTATDANLCTATQASVIISEPAALSIDSAVTTNTTCTGTNDGTAKVYVAGGTSGYSYSWSTGGTSFSITAGAGTYSVTITDANGCTIDTSATISSPGSLVLSPSVDTVACYGDSAAVSVSVSGGTSPYFYLWSNGNNTPGAGSLPMGTYAVTVSDINGCFTDTVAAVYEPALLLTNIDFADVNCFGVNDGMAWASPSGGTSPYSFLWNTAAINDSIFNLSPSTVSVTVTDANGCSDVDTAIVSEPSALSMTATLVNPTCAAGNNGSISTSVSGSVSPYSYSWSNLATTSQISNLTSQTYTVTVSDTNGCTLDSSFTLTDPSAVVISSIVLNLPSCFGDSTGSAAATATGGASPYAYSWNTGGTTSSVSGIPSSTYSVTVNDSNGCTADSSFNLSQPAALTATLSATDETVPALNDGTATANPGGGTGGYNYNWSNSGTTQTISNLAPGSYIVTVTDNNGCEFIDSIFVSAAGCLLVIDSVAQTNVLCFGANSGTATVYASLGSGTYSYSWTNGQTAQTTTGLSAQTYSVTVTDDLVAGCKKSASVTITQPPAAVDDTVQVNAVLCNGGTGSATSTPSGGVAPYNFSWSTGGTGSTETNVTAGSHSVTITDANGCSVVKAFTMTQPSAALTGTVSVTNESCNGCNDGVIAGTASGGTTPYLYQWDGNTGNQTTATATGLAPGNFCYTITDANACTYSNCANVTAYACSMTASASAADASACTSGDAMAMAAANGGDVPYTYAWSSGDTTQNISNLSSSTYSVTITDSKNCTATASTNVVDNNFSVQIDSIVATNASCNGVCNGSVAVYVSGGQTPYSYLWNNGALTIATNGLCDGTYAVTVTESGGGCTGIDSVAVSEPSALIVTISSTDESAPGANDGTATAATTGGTSPYVYQWDNGATSDSLSGLAAGTYIVTATDTNGCSVEDSVTISTAAPTSCISNTPHGVADAPTNDIPAAIAADNHAGEYGTVNLIVTSQTYQFSSSVSTDWLVLTTASDSVLVEGTTPISWIATFNGTVRLHIFADSACSTQNSARATSVQCLSCPPPSCLGTFPYGTADAPANNLTEIIDSCNYAGDFATVTSVASGQTYQFSSSISTDWLTLTDASNNLLIEGASPISWIATFDGNVRLHIHTDSACGTQDSCRMTSVQCISCCSGFTASASATDETSPGANDGTATASVSGGTASYSYLWSNGGTTQTIDSLAPGNYTVTVTDSAGCVATGIATVNAAGCNLLVSLTITDETVVGANDGAITAVGAGGTLPYSYSWSNGDTSQTITNLAPNYYCVSVTDADSCITTACDSVAPGLNAISETGNMVSFAIYPNPNDGKFRLVISNGLPVKGEMAIYNVLGEIVYSEKQPPSTGAKQGTGNYQLTTNLSSGIYFVALKYADIIKVEKLVIE